MAAEAHGDLGLQRRKEELYRPIYAGTNLKSRKSSTRSCEVKRNQSHNQDRAEQRVDQELVGFSKPK